MNLNLVPMDGGHKSVAVGLCGYRSLRAHHNPKTMRDCHSYMDPSTSALATSVERMGRLTNKKLNVFTDRDDGQQPDVRPPARVPRQERGRPHRRTERSSLRALEVHALEAPAARAAGDLPARPLALRRHGRLRGRDGGRARADARKQLRAVPRPGRRPGRHPHHGHPVHQPVQRQLVPQPAARAGDGERVPLQPLQGRRRW